MKFPEKLLHFLWQHKLIPASNLWTTKGEHLQILQFGNYNTNSGPDFEYAKIKVGETTWVGNVEIHLKDSDWYHHNHHLDYRYNTTILHVVWESTGQDAIRLDNTIIPTLSLKGYIDPKILDRYNYLLYQETDIPCAYKLPQISSIYIAGWLDRMLVERLQEKALTVERWLNQTKYNWEQVCIISMGRSFGMNVNQHAFEQLMSQVPISLIMKYHGGADQLEALLFGSAGLLRGVPDEAAYVSILKKEYSYLSHLHQLQSMEEVNWKFLRMRPFNFPTLRLAQLCALLRKRIQWFAFVLENEMETLRRELVDAVPHDFWIDHYTFTKVSRKHSTKLTHSFIDHLIINTFAPLLFAYGKYIGENVWTEKAVSWLEQLKAETNTVTKKFEELGVHTSSAAQSQAVLYLYRQYCTPKRCLDCSIGYHCLKDSNL